ncbi:hypothetical protein FJ641_11040 [Clostridium perfringens]|nr:hypothetical protein [Clostridium perfringens]
MKNSKEHWNSDNLRDNTTEEFKYLDDLDSLMVLSKEITKILNRIINREEWCIDCEKEKIKIDYFDIGDKLQDISKSVSSIFEEMKQR